MKPFVSSWAFANRPFYADPWILKKIKSTDFLPRFPWFPLFSKGITGKPPGWFFGKATTTENNQQLAGPCFPSNKTMFFVTKTTNKWLKLQSNLEPLIPYQQRHLWIDDDDFCHFPKAGGILLMLQKSGALTATWDAIQNKKPISWDMVYQTSTGATNRSVRRISFEEWSTVRLGGE